MCGAMLPYVFVLANGFSFFFCTNKRKTKQKENSPAAFFLPTPALFYAKQKELASLKQLFVFNAPKSTSASRQKKEAGTRHFQSLITYNL